MLTHTQQYYTSSLNLTLSSKLEGEHCYHVTGDHRHMYTAERQRAQPYLEKVSGPLYEQWYLLHHRMIRIVTNHAALAGHVRDFLYYAELLAEYTYESAS